MRIHTIGSSLVIGGLSLAGATAQAGFSSTMFEVASNPSTWGDATEIASLDSSSFDYADASGFEAVLANIVFDRTAVSTNVYRMNAARVVSTGNASLTLDPGDLVFAYSLRLVGNFAGLTINALNEAQVIGAPDFGFGQNPMAASLINGQGFVTTGHGRDPLNGNIDDAAELGSSVDFEWGGANAIYLLNDQTITMLLFSDPAEIGRGVLNMSSPPGQAGGIEGVAQADGAPPVLIPIVPAPGAAALALVGGTLLLRRRGR
ncbi:MAG: hypothetical protein SFZ24_04975 [Planctomycetota bacterium]|nr:hypothetical protein [Planctomycetota bacterium]